MTNNQKIELINTVSKFIAKLDIKKVCDDYKIDLNTVNDIIELIDNFDEHKLLSCPADSLLFLIIEEFINKIDVKKVTKEYDIILYDASDMMRRLSDYNIFFKKLVVINDNHSTTKFKPYIIL